MVDSLLQVASALAMTGTTMTRKISGTTNTNEEYQYGSETEYEESPEPEMTLDPADREAEEGIYEKVAQKEDSVNGLAAVNVAAAMDQEVWISSLCVHHECCLVACISLFSG